MSDHCIIPHPLKREGTYQWQRLAEGLKEGFYKPDDRSLEQLVMQVAQFASYVKYYDTTLNESGNWEAFFEFLYDYQSNKLKFTNIDSLLSRGDLPPHLGLLLSFLKTFQSARDEMNTYTNRHLNFYYNDVLQLKHKAAVADKVAVIFEPEKNTVQAKVPAATALNAGKDATSKELVYTTTREIIVNQVTVAEKKSIYADIGNAGKLNGLYMSNDAATDNLFIQNNIANWYPFGYTDNTLASLGFAVSSPMLFAKEGRRRLSIEIDGGASLPRTSLEAYFTGPKGWVNAEVDITPGINNQGTAMAKRFLLVKISEALPAIVAYDEKVHKMGLSATNPVVKLLVKNDSHFPAAYDFFTGLRATSIKKLVMNVEGAKSFTLAGDNGRLNPLQAFKPFGSTPVKNKSFFTIGSNEAFNKYLKTFHLAANWKGAPGNMFKYYDAYDEFLIGRMKEPVVGSSRHRVGGVSKLVPYTAFRSPLVTFDQGNVPGKMELLNGGKWLPVSEDTPNQYAVRKAGTYNTFHAGGKINDAYEPTPAGELNEASKSGFAKVTLQYDFGHHHYAAVLADVIMQNTKETVAANIKPIPQPPYTPEFNSLHLDYVLEDTVDISAKKEHQFFQLHPFGYNPISSSQQTLLPTDYKFHGQLYIGLANCTVPQIVNLYIARLDGTEDIDAVINEKISWHYLKGSTWVKFKFESIVLNTTLDFTSGGFISFSIPEDALEANTLMGRNLVWIKAVSISSANAYPSILDIHVNAAEATFSDHDNDPLHLQNPLPAGSIAKPVLKIDGVKAVSQPYASFGGSMPEQDEQFNTRVSERLRHKSRAWSIWDYEHLVLEQFPSIYKIKAISHAQKDAMYMPGHVLCIALPATTNIAEKDLLQPRLSKALLTAAADYIGQFKTVFSQVEFANPVYETITVTCSVKIRDGYDENFYTTQLNKDLQAFISPWISNRSISPSFGGTIYASSIINFIEEREYIDYLTFFEASKLEQNKLVTWKGFTTGSSEEVILTSAEQHKIDSKAIC